MHRGTAFHIRWDNNSLIYNPLQSVIKNCHNGQKIPVNKNCNIPFPDLQLRNSYQEHFFRPTCLTVFTGLSCNLSCRYCYAHDKNNYPNLKISPDAVKEAAEFVSLNCSIQKQPFALGFHGGNEPLIFKDTICEYIEISKKIIRKYDLDLMLFCTTNGVISAKTALWAAKNFHNITLSWDGPPEIHNLYRLKANGEPTESIVKDTAGILMSPYYGLKRLNVRVTVTRKSVHRLSEIIVYLYKNGIKHIIFHPLYQNHEKTVNPALIPPKIDFVKHFLFARKKAGELGMHIEYAGTRLNHFHDRFCPIFQNNFTLTTDGYVTACFQKIHNIANINDEFMYGNVSRDNKEKIDWNKLTGIYEKFAKPYSQCKTCFNYWHCAKGCPDICPMNISVTESEQIDCTIEKWIGLSNIVEAAGFQISDQSIDDCENFFSKFEVTIIGKDNNGRL